MHVCVGAAWQGCQAGTCEVQGLSPNSEHFSGHGVTLDGQAPGLVQGLGILAQRQQRLAFEQQRRLHCRAVQPDGFVSLPLGLPANSTVAQGSAQSRHRQQHKGAATALAWRTAHLYRLALEKRKGWLATECCNLQGVRLRPARTQTLGLFGPIRCLPILLRFTASAKTPFGEDQKTINGCDQIFSS